MKTGLEARYIKLCASDTLQKYFVREVLIHGLPVEKREVIKSPVSKMRLRHLTPYQR